MITPDLASSWNESRFHDFSHVTGASNPQVAKQSLVAHWRREDGDQIETGGKRTRKNSDFTSCIDESIAMQDLEHGLTAIKEILDESRKLVNAQPFKGGREVDTAATGISIKKYTHQAERMPTFGSYNSLS